MYQLPVCTVVMFMLLVFFPVALHAEVVLMKDGKTIKGRVTGQSRNAIKLRNEKGTVTIQKKAIAKIQYVPFSPAQKKAQRDVYRKRLADIRKRREKLEQLQLQKERREYLQKQLVEEEQKEKEARARETAERAAALRELVAKGQMEKPEDEPISYWDFAWRSLVLPGWGHFEIERPWFGYLYMGGTAALLSNVVHQRRIATAATNENHSQVERNYLLSLVPNLASREIRVAYSYYANANAAIVYQAKVRDYHNSLYALAVFYGVNVIHIIYNAIAWENGLLIVEGQDTRPATHVWQPALSLHPDLSPGNADHAVRHKTNSELDSHLVDAAIVFRMTYRF